MATVVGAIAGSSIGFAIGGPVGGFIGQAIGGLAGAFADRFILSSFAAPPQVLQGSSDARVQEFVGQRLDDLQVQFASEGSPMKFVLGPSNRVGGTVIWVDPLGIEEQEIVIETTVESESQNTVTTRSGGKGGFVGGRVVHSETRHIPLNRWQSSLARKQVTHYESRPSGYGGGGSSTSTSTSTQTNIRIDRIFEYYLSFAVAACEGPVADINKIYANGKSLADFRNEFDGVQSGTEQTLEEEENGNTTTIVETSATATFVDDVRVYLGSQTAPDPLIAASEASAPAFVSTAYVVFERLNLRQFGYTIPQLNFFVAAQDGYGVGSALQALASRAGIDEAFIDTSRCSDCFRGLVLSGGQQMAPAMLSIMQAYDVVARESGNTVEFMDRGLEDEFEASESDMLSEDGQRPITYVDRSELDLPTQVDVRYIDEALDLQSGGQTVRRVSYRFLRQQTLNLGLTLSSDEAITAAEKMLWLEHVQRVNVSFRLSPRFVFLRPNDILNITLLDSSTLRVRINRVEIGANYAVQVRGVVEAQDISNYTGSTTPRNVEGPSIYTPPAMRVLLFQGPPLGLEQLNSIGVYYAACAADPEKRFISAVVQETRDSGDTFFDADVLRAEAIIGTCTTVLPSGVTEGIDRVSTVRVRLSHGTLSSSTLEQVSQGLRNQARIGSEYVGFLNAVLVDDRTYELSGFTRGLRDTQTTVHAANETFVLLDRGQGGGFLLKEQSSTGETRKIRVVPFGGRNDNYAATEVTLTDESLRPFRPAHVSLTRDGSNDLQASWTRVSRSFNSVFGEFGAFDLETPESSTREYELLFYEGSTLRSTKTVSGAETYSYSAAQRALDGFSSDTADVGLRVRQINLTASPSVAGNLSVEVVA